MNNDTLLRDYDPETEGTMLERYDKSRKLYTQLMKRSLEQRFQQWLNRKCSDQIKMYEHCVSDKWPWQLSNCEVHLDKITKCRLD